ncbi:axin interactor, dorsalization-associated protein-like isoform X2 [Babylonia areolata]
MMAEDDVSILLKRWQAAFKRATDFDMWGQPVEAIDVYQRLSKQLHQYSSSDDSTFSDAQKKTLEKIAVCLDSRERALQSQKSAQSAGVSLNDLKRLESTFQSILGGSGSSSKSEFPLDVSLAQVQYQQLLCQQDGMKRKSQEERAEEQGRGSLLPRPLPVVGMTLLTVRVEQLGLKDASQFIDPFLTVSVKDNQGQDMMASQDTPPAQEKRDTCIIFNMDVHIQKAIESLPPGFAVFFELKHYKPKKQMVSTRCWACLEKDEIKEGPLALELYKKPTDYRRKNINLLTVKPLYLHLRLQLFR